MTQPNSLRECPFCGGPLEAKVIAEGLHAEGWCEACAWSMEEWDGDLAKLIERMNRRSAATDGSALAEAVKMRERLEEAEDYADRCFDLWAGLVEHHTALEIAVQKMMAEGDGIEEVRRLLDLEGDMKPSAEAIRILRSPAKAAPQADSAVEIGREIAGRILAWLKDDSGETPCPDDLASVGMPMPEGLFKALCYLCDAALRAKPEAGDTDGRKG